MQDEKQYELLILQYQQLKNGAEDIAKLIEEENYDSALTMIKSREPIFLNCKCMRKYLELTPVQQNEVDKILDEIRTLELQNIKKLEKEIDIVHEELTKTQKSQRMQNAYEFDENEKGSIINLEE